MENFSVAKNLIVRPTGARNAGARSSFVFQPLSSQCIENVIPAYAVFLATGTPVRLLPENSITHNDRHCVLCIEAGVPCCCETVLADAGVGL